MESWIMDARYAARRLVRRPLYALLSVLTLALGIGGIASVYGIARPILLDPLPYRRKKGWPRSGCRSTGPSRSSVPARRIPGLLGSRGLPERQRAARPR